MLKSAWCSRPAPCGQSRVGRAYQLRQSRDSFAHRTGQGAWTGRARQRVVSASARRNSRLATRITTIPRRIEFYFADNLPRRALWGAITFFAGFYAANTVSLSFGALAINDVVAAAVTVAFCELCSSAYYGAERKTLKLLIVNCFKLGVIAALVADALKLGG